MVRAFNGGTQLVPMRVNRDMRRRTLSTTPVHIWFVDSHTVSDSGLAGLSNRHLTSAERNRLDTGLLTRCRVRAVSYLLRRLVLSVEFGGALESWLFSEDQNGRPFVASPKFARRLSISMARTQGIAAFAYVWDQKFGIDIESTSHKATRLRHVSRTFSQEEQEELASAPDKNARAIDFWTLKEAYGKALGVGLEIVIDQCRFDLSDLSAPRLARWGVSDDTGTDWHFMVSSPRSDTRLAMASRAVGGEHHTPSVQWVESLEAAYSLYGSSPNQTGHHI